MEPLLDLIDCSESPLNLDIIVGNLFIKPMIKELRKARGYSQKELAQRLGVAQSTLSSWESGTNAMDINTIIKLAFLLRVSFEGIMNIPLTTFVKEKEPLGFDKEFIKERSFIIQQLEKATSLEPYTVKHVAYFRDDTLEPVFDGQTGLSEKPASGTYTLKCPKSCCFAKHEDTGATAVVVGDLELEDYEDGDYVVAAVKGRPVTICRIFFQSTNNETFFLTYPEEATPPILFDSYNLDKVTLLGKVVKVDLDMG